MTNTPTLIKLIKRRNKRKQVFIIQIDTL